MHSIIKRFNTFPEFVEYNRNYIDRNIVLNIYLIKSIHSVINNPNLLIAFFNIKKGDKTIIVLLLKDVCLIYGNLEDDSSILILEQELQFHKFNRYTFAGIRNIISKLLNKTNSKYSTVKHLSIYKCLQTKSINDYNKDNIQLIEVNEVDELFEFLKQFHSEFYEGYSTEILPEKKYLEEIIAKGNYYKYIEDGQTIAVGNIENDKGFPELSLVFTIKEKRNQNIGTKLSHYLTSICLEKSNFVMLYTKGDNLSAKKVFEKIGYFNNGEYTMFYKEE
jgi:predicted GNAT family acetyltransferase